MSDAGGTPPSDWRRVSDLFHRALELPAEAREAFLEHEGHGDTDLVAEVRSLLAAHERAAGFIETPAAEAGELDALARSMPIDGRAIGPYRLKRVLGEGGMGVVYLAEDTRLGRTVALKALAGRHAADPVRTERLRREARAAARLGHPGIATVFALDEIDGQLYLASEYVPGDTLRDEIARGPLGVERARETGLAIAHALAAAHARGVVHRDLKPENVVRRPDDTIKVLDFGLARIEDERGGLQPPALTDVGSAIGTPAYMAPEQIRGGPVDARADLFALGIVIHELATGRHPFETATRAGTIARILEDEPARLAENARQTSGPADAAAMALDRVVAICLRKSPDARFQSALELIEALDGADGPFPTAPARPPEPRDVEGADAPSRTTADHPARWWWQFHQGATTVAYLLLLGPLWGARHLGSDTFGMWLFLAGLVAVIVAGALRLHLWFAARQYPEDWAAQHTVSRRWIRAADLVFTAVLLVGGIRAIRSEAPAALLVAAASAVAVSSTIIEPATTRAAFGRH